MQGVIWYFLHRHKIPPGNAQMEAPRPVTRHSIRHSGQVIAGTTKIATWFPIHKKKITLAVTFFAQIDLKVIKVRAIIFWPFFSRAKVLPKHSVLDVMKITYREISDRANASGWYHEKMLEEFRREVIKRVAGIQVRTMFNNKTYRVDDVDFRLSPGKIFF